MSNKKTITIRATNGSEIEMSKRKEILTQLNKYRRQGEPETVEELEERINGYLRWAMDVDVMPSVESLSIACGVCRTTFFRWTRGEGRGRDRQWQNTCIMARQLLNANLEIEAEDGTLPVPVAIFALKNTAAWSDTRPLDAYEALVGGYGYVEPSEDPAALLQAYKERYAIESGSGAYPNGETLSEMTDAFMDVPDEPLPLPEWL